MKREQKTCQATKTETKVEDLKCKDTEDDEWGDYHKIEDTMKEEPLVQKDEKFKVSEIGKCWFLLIEFIKLDATICKTKLEVKKLENNMKSDKNCELANSDSEYDSDSGKPKPDDLSWFKE